jgi:hypothetical protein
MQRIKQKQTNAKEFKALSAEKIVAQTPSASQQPVHIGSEAWGFPTVGRLL